MLNTYTVFEKGNVYVYAKRKNGRAKEYKIVSNYKICQFIFTIFASDFPIEVMVDIPYFVNGYHGLVTKFVRRFKI